MLRVAGKNKGREWLRNHVQAPVSGDVARKDFETNRATETGFNYKCRDIVVVE
jgi:hypothetical protein